MTDNHAGVDALEPHEPGTARAASEGSVDGHPTTTHAAAGAGRPRLIFKVGEDWDGTAPREFDLLDPITRIGSSDEMDLRLDGLEPFHAEIVHDDNDEYVLSQVTGETDQSTGILDQESRGTATPIPETVLRTGSPVVLGTWNLSYYREEFADHGRPYGGREGGEGTHQPQQPE